MNQRLTYRSKARLTTSDSVSPLACAFSKAAFQRASGTRTARGMSGIDDLHFRIKACPGSIVQGGNGKNLVKACDCAWNPVTFPGGEYNARANPLLLVFHGLAGFGGADGRESGVHFVSLVSACIYRIGQAVSTPQAHLADFLNVRFGCVA
jgi:hypothetical protein